MSVTAAANPPDSPLFALETSLGASWPQLGSTYRETERKLKDIASAIEGMGSPDSIVVVNGSLARREFTQGSDLDWFMLVDGQANTQNQKTFLEIDQAIRKVYSLQKPGREGTFGKLVFSQPIMHRIGGEEDTNSNTTRRILLLLEALPIGERPDCFARVRTGILRRYLDEDRGLLQIDHDGKMRWIPLFLLNDLARYWRTMAVDFAYKQYDRGGDGYSLRSIKLGISRKLMFASGLLACFWCDPKISGGVEQGKSLQSLIDCLDDFLSSTPLERLARFFNGHVVDYDDVLRPFAEDMFGAYDEFLGILNDPDRRKSLERVKPQDADNDAEFQNARKVRRRFSKALESTFLHPKSPLYEFTIKKGIF